MLDSIVRTIVPKIVGVLLGLVPASVVVPDTLSTALTIAVGAAVLAVVEIVYYVVGRLLEMRWPGAGRVLLGLGLPVGKPQYLRTTAGGAVRLPPV
jgi:hypothetical protein